MTLDVELATASPEIDVFWLQSRFTAACGYLEIDQAGIALRLVDSAGMAEAHLRFCGVNEPTDVLTFDRGPGEGADVLAADVLLCVDVARTEALERGHPVQEEVLLYLIHAMLHCLGHDDHDEMGAREMHRIEDDVLESIGIGRRFGNAEQPVISKNPGGNTGPELDNGD